MTSPNWYLFDNTDQIKELFGMRPCRIYMGVVYAVEYGTLLKIGSTASPYRRLRAIQSNSKNYGTIQVGKIMISSLHTNYRENEKLLHQEFKDSRVKAELFDLKLGDFSDNCGFIDFLDETEKLAKKTEQDVDKLLSIIGITRR